MEWNGWNGKSGMKWNDKNGMKWNEMEWNEMIIRNGLNEWNVTKWNEMK